MSSTTEAIRNAFNQSVNIHIELEDEELKIDMLFVRNCVVYIDKWRVFNH
jgi:hypothetical protein